MSPQPNTIEIQGLLRRYGKQDAVNGLNLTVQRGRCHGFFGRNGAGKTTTVKCLLNLLQPMGGSVRVFGLDPSKDEVQVKSRLSYVPDAVAFYPWMSVREVLDYHASFRSRWNRDLENDLLKRFGLNLKQTAQSMSKGQKTQIALIAAICPEPELLVLDEPTSGLDPIVRREFIETVIGAYQSGDPENRTVLVSTHLISEFEGLIDNFTIIDHGKEILSMEADAAREQFKRISVRFEEAPGALDFPEALQIKQNGRDANIVTDKNTDRLMAQLRSMRTEDVQSQSLSLEEIFVASQSLRKANA